MEEAILSEDNHVCAGDLLIIHVKLSISGSDLPALEMGSRCNYRSLGGKYVHGQCFHLNVLGLLLSEFTGRESLEWDML